ncbi:MAG: hypothetical protein KJT03_11625, partial [Verrucomicrobiae bacterium]|nr:hypothetical protein [Verrucomicrobiae bacterium]
ALGVNGTYLLLDSSIPVGLRLVESLYTAIQYFTLAYPDWLVFSANDSGNVYLINWQIQIARFLAPAVSVTALISLFSSTLDKWFKRFCLKYLYRGHAVIFGFNLRTRMLCEDLVRRGIRVVLADPNLTLDEKTWLRKQGVIAFDLSGTDSAAAAICRVEKANYLFAAHEEDSLNLKILVVLYQRNKEVFGTSVSAQSAKEEAHINTRCFIHFSQMGFRNLKFGTQFSDLGDYFSLRIFSVYDYSARLLTRSIYLKYAKDILEGKPLRILMIGTGKTSQALLEQLIRMSFFDMDRSATIHVIDESEKGWQDLKARFPIITLDSSYYREEDAERIDALKEQIGFPRMLFSRLHFDSVSFLTGQAFANDHNKEEVNIAILSSPDATRNLTIADALVQQSRVPIKEIFVRTDEQDTEIRSFMRSDLERKHLSSFPTLDEICRLSCLEESSVELLAKVIHEEYLKEVADSSGTQPSLKPWSQLEESFKESNRRAAAHLEIKCSLLGLSYLNLDNNETVMKAVPVLRKHLRRDAPESYLEHLAECEHSRWCIEKLLDGWVPGKVRNDARKEHPNLVPWEFDSPELERLFEGFDRLTEPDKQKDRNNIEKIPLLLEELIAEKETHGDRQSRGSSAAS